MTPPLRASAAAKINLALVVGPRRADGLHELTSIVQRIDLCDRLALAPGRELAVEGFPGDTLVRDALRAVASAAETEPRWRVTLEKRIPVAAGLGGGSADAAAALLLANRALGEPLGAAALRGLGTRLGADVPFFLEPGPKLVEGAGEELEHLELPQDFWVLVALPAGAVKASTGAVYARFDELRGAAGFAERRELVRRVARGTRRPRELAQLPPNDLAPAAGSDGRLPRRLVALGAFRADVSGAGPAVYGLFLRRRAAERAAAALPRGTRTWVVAPVW
jgi:4-diphosphocytidyl-2-C-methyl-D-erythritol kinase